MTEPPRLLYIDDIPTPYRLDVHRLIAKRWPGAYKILFLAGAEPGRSWDFDFTGLDVEVLPGRQFAPMSARNPFQIKWNPSTRHALRSYRPDVVVLSGYVHPTVQVAAHWCRSNAVPYAVVCESNVRSSATSGSRWLLKRITLRPMLKGMSFALPLGKEAEVYLRSFGLGEVPMYHFPNSPDVEAIAQRAVAFMASGKEADLRRSLGLPSSAKLALYVGRLIEIKRPLDAVVAFEGLSPPDLDAALVMVGDGPLMPECQAACKRNNRIFCVGWIKDQEILVGLMAMSSMLLLPSESETWGAVVNEAMAAGVPVVASDHVGAAIEMIEDGRNGFVHPVGDVDAIRRAMRRLWADQADWQRIGAAARQTVLSKGHAFAAENLVTGAMTALRRCRTTNEPI